jgi:hypothetical protein
MICNGHPGFHPGYALFSRAGESVFSCRSQLAGDAFDRLIASKLAPTDCHLATLMLVSSP